MSLSLSQQVREFHKKYGYALDKPLIHSSNMMLPMEQRLKVIGAELQMKSWGEMLRDYSKHIMEKAIELQALGDDRLYRVFLMTDEIGEVFVALADGDETRLADALGDTKYVIEGTGENYGLPLDHVTNAIHESNMTKSGDGDDNKMKRKGPDWKKPDIAAAVERGRKQRAWEQSLREGEIGTPKDKIKEMICHVCKTMVPRSKVVLGDSDREGKGIDMHCPDCGELLTEVV